MALAVRVKCPIFIDEDVVANAGRPVSEITVKGTEGAEPAQATMGKELSEVEQLRLRLQKAVEAEKYEEAAAIRDKLRQLEQEA